MCDDPSLLPATVDDKLVHVTSSSRDTSDSSALSAATTINKLQMLHFCTMDKWTRVVRVYRRFGDTPGTL